MEGPTCGRASRLIGYSKDAYIVEVAVAAWALAAVWSFAANWATTPSCCIMPKAYVFLADVGVKVNRRIPLCKRSGGDWEAGGGR